MDEEIGSFRRLLDAGIGLGVAGQHDLLAVEFDDIAERRLDLLAAIDLDGADPDAVALVDDAVGDDPAAAQTTTARTPNKAPSQLRTNVSPIFGDVIGAMLRPAILSARTGRGRAPREHNVTLN
ncbi:hypothetical protein S58_46630 [Bradyrhizobium oligotrophicum S58]|uniref:Uncharacterized protein n=1 Tax=Bradyrhizobium oligotrophicum S58 TaxID=1245469 RepID=M4ZAB2_9BRAD|nr:hypothetical protein [Bradyrhizobium oligotrophicum]BAM90644.1 hypothetical protein S58_46630 [Bradyrhizobium oligotrophicum S58]